MMNFSCLLTSFRLTRRLGVLMLLAAIVGVVQLQAKTPSTSALPRSSGPEASSTSGHPYSGRNVTHSVAVGTNSTLAFNGSNNYVAGSNSLLPQNNTARTLEAWVNPSNTNVGIFTYGTNANNQRAGLSLVNNKLSYSGSGNDLVGATALSLGTWHHVAATYDGTTLKLYVDGALDASQTMPVFNTTGTGFLVGYTGNAATEYLNGRIDEVRVYNTALTPAQVMADMFSTTSAVPASQVAYYNFDQGMAGGTNTGITTLTDQSGNNKNGMLVNFALTGTSSNWVRSFPTISGLSPTSGPAGTSVTLTGTNLMDVTGFKFNGTAVAPFATPTNDLTATVTVPNGATTGAVSVTSTTLTAYNSPTFTVMTCPLPTAITQNKTVALGANGSGTLAATAVNNASTPTNCGNLTYQVQKVMYGQVAQGQTLTFTAPAGAVFTDVTFASYGTPTGTNGNYVLGSCHGPNSQAVVAQALVGNNTGSIHAENGVFGDPCNGTSKTLAVQVVYTVPAAQVSYTCADVAGPNYVLLTVTDAANNKSTSTAQVMVTAPTAATITSISPAASSVGQTVTVTGTNLGAATGLTVNGTAATIGSNTGTSFTFVVPSGATATGNVVVSAPCAPASIAFAVAADLVVSTTMTIPAGTYNTITVTGTGNGTLAGDVTVNTGLVIQDGGILNDRCNLITGSGTFTLAAGGTLAICRTRGILAVGDPLGNVGLVRVTGGRSFSSDANYIYKGSDVTGSGLPSQVRNLSIFSPTSVGLTQSTSVTQVLTLSNNGNLNLGNQTLTLLSSAAGTALVVNSDKGVVIGNTSIVQRYIDPSKNTGLGYRHYSAPVSGATVASLATVDFVPVLTAAYNTAATPGTTTPFPNVFAYDQTRVASATNNLSAFDKGFVVPASTGTMLAVGQGYTVNIGAAPLVSFVGTLTNGTQTVSLARNSGTTAADAGWALVGNPYPAPLDFNLITPNDRTGLDAGCYVFESNTPYTGSYRTSVNGIPSSTYIGSGQGFFVRVSTGQTAGTLTFRNNQRLTSYTAQVPMRRGTADTRPLVQLELRGATGPADVLYAYAENGATPAFDTQFDAVKLPNSTGLNLASLATTSEALAIDGRPAFTAATVLPLTVGVPAAGSYSLTAAALSNLPAGLDAFLSDAVTGRTVNLSQQPAYAFNVTTAQAATLITGRFALSFAARSVLATTTALTAAEVTLYPNPTHAAFTVLVPAVAGAGLVQATLFNALGQVVRQQAAALPTAGARLVVETADLAAGVYTLRLLVGTTTLAKRVVLQ